MDARTFSSLMGISRVFLSRLPKTLWQWLDNLKKDRHPSSSFSFEKTDIYKKGGDLGWLLIPKMNCSGLRGWSINWDTSFKCSCALNPS